MGLISFLYVIGGCLPVQLYVNMLYMCVYVYVAKKPGFSAVQISQILDCISVIQVF